MVKLKPTACLAAAAALGEAAAVDRLAAATTQAHVLGVHLLLCPLQFTPESATFRKNGRQSRNDGRDGTHRLLSNDRRVGGGLHGLLLLWNVDLRHFVW